MELGCTALSGMGGPRGSGDAEDHCRSSCHTTSMTGSNRFPCLPIQVFEVDTSRGQPEGYSLAVEPARRSELSQRINALLADLRSGRSHYAGCFVVRQGARAQSLDCAVCGLRSGAQSASCQPWVLGYQISMQLR